MIHDDDGDDHAPTDIYSQTMMAIQRAMLAVLAERGEATSDDARARVAIPDGVDPRIVGVAISGLVRDRQITQAGTAITGRPIAHGRLTRVWRLANPHAEGATP